MRTSKRDVLVRALAAASVSLAVCVTSGCRVGGPSGDTITPEGGTIDTPDARMDAGTAADAGTPPPSTVDAAREADVPGGDGGQSAGGDAATADASAAPACTPDTAIRTCDPVCNTGCPFLSRCTVSDTPDQGSCIGIWIATEGSDCIKTASTDPCAVQLSCVNGKCRHLCYHDADCAGATGGACCVESIEVSGGPSGFRACGPCAP